MYRLNQSVKLTLMAFLIAALQEMPYGYYELLKIVLFFGLLAIALFEWKRGIFIFIPVYIAFAIVFNPLVEFSFDRDQWQVIDKLGIGVLFGLFCFDLCMQLVVFKKHKPVNLEPAKNKEVIPHVNNFTAIDKKLNKLDGPEREQFVDDLCKELDLLKLPTNEGDDNKLGSRS